MLVGAFEVEIGQPVLGPILAVAQHEGMGRAGIEPHVQDVVDLVPLGRIVTMPKETLLGAVLVPGIRALGLERLEDAGVHLFVAQQEVSISGHRALLVKQVSGTPQARWRRQHPVGPRLDHRVQPVAPGLRRPGHQLVD